MWWANIRDALRLIAKHYDRLIYPASLFGLIVIILNEGSFFFSLFLMVYLLLNVAFDIFLIFAGKGKTGQNRLLPEQVLKRFSLKSSIILFTGLFAVFLWFKFLGIAIRWDFRWLPIVIVILILGRRDKLAQNSWLSDRVFKIFSLRSFVFYSIGFLLWSGLSGFMLQWDFQRLSTEVGFLYFLADLLVSLPPAFYFFAIFMFTIARMSLEGESNPEAGKKAAKLASASFWEIALTLTTFSVLMVSPLMLLEDVMLEVNVDEQISLIFISLLFSLCLLLLITSSFVLYTNAVKSHEAMSPRALLANIASAAVVTLAAVAMAFWLHSAIDDALMRDDPARGGMCGSLISRFTVDCINPDCRKIIYGSERDQCLWHEAEASNSPALCEEIEDEFDEGDCLKRVAVALNDSKICDKIQTNLAKSDCERNFRKVATDEFI